MSERETGQSVCEEQARRFPQVESAISSNAGDVATTAHPPREAQTVPASQPAANIGDPAAGEEARASVAGEDASADAGGAAPENPRPQPGGVTARRGRRDGTDKPRLKGRGGRAIFAIIAAMAELERNIILERIHGGLRRARAEGKRLGRPPVAVDAGRVPAMRAEELSVRQIAWRLGASKSKIGAMLKGRTPSPAPGSASA